MPIQIKDHEGNTINTIVGSVEFAQQMFPGMEYIEVPDVPPGPVIPQSVTMRQARLALLAAGLIDDVEAAIAALPSPHKEAAKIEWEYSQEVQRHNGFVAQLGPVLGIDADALDALFVAAARL